MTTGRKPSRLVAFVLSLLMVFALSGCAGKEPDPYNASVKLRNVTETPLYWVQVSLTPDFSTALDVVDGVQMGYLSYGGLEIDGVMEMKFPRDSAWTTQYWHLRVVDKNYNICTFYNLSPELIQDGVEIAFRTDFMANLFLRFTMPDGTRYTMEPQSVRAV